MSGEDVGFELHVTAHLQALWDEIGLDEQSRISQMNELRISFRLLYQDAVEKLAMQCQETRDEIQKVQAAHKQAMKAFGLSETEIHDSLQPGQQPASLLQQLEISNQSYQSFRVLCDERVRKLEDLTRAANVLFDRLGISREDRGEFGDLGDSDYSPERIERFNAKVEELEECVASQTQQIETLRSQIATIVAELQSPLSGEQQMVFQTEGVSLGSIAALNGLLQSLENEKERRMGQVMQFAIEITRLWDLLAIEDDARGEFLRTHSTIGEDALKACAEEVARLSQLRDARLPALIESQKMETEELWNKLHIPVQSRPAFDPQAGDQNEGVLVREFQFYEAEIVRLTKFMDSLHPLLATIGEREEIVNEYQSICESTNSAQRLLSRERGYAQRLMREEKARRRYKKSLPKVEKKLAQMLAEYKTTQGADFEWDGRPYIEHLVDFDYPHKGHIVDAPVGKIPQKTSPKKPRCESLGKAGNGPLSPRKSVRNNENMAYQPINLG
jgi:hypothetical protein